MITYFLVLYMWIPSEALWGAVGDIAETPSLATCDELISLYASSMDLPDGMAVSCEERTTL